MARGEQVRWRTFAAASCSFSRSTVADVAKSAKLEWEKMKPARQALPRAWTMGGDAVAANAFQMSRVSIPESFLPPPSRERIESCDCN